MDVSATLEKSDEDLRADYFPDLTDAFSQHHRWECVKRTLDALLPTLSVLNAEAELKMVTKDPKGYFNLSIAFKP